MVDPISLTLGGAVAALVAKAAEKAGAGMAAGGVEVLARLRSRLRARLDGSPNGQVLAELEDVPDSPSRAQGLATVVDQLAVEDTAFAAEIAALVRSAQDAGVEVQAINQSIQGQGNVQAAGVDSSSITVSYGQPPPPPPPSLPSPPNDRH